MRLVPILYGAAAVLGLLFVRFVIYEPFDHDEIEHAHVAWRLLQGDRPYADFHQNHAPPAWWIAAAALRVLPESGVAVLALRLFTVGTLALAIAAGWRAIERLGAGVHPLVRPLSIVGAICLAYRYEWYRYRPDPFMSLAATLAVVVAMARDITNVRAAAAGALLGAAGSFSPKMWPLLAILPVRLALDAWHGGGWQPVRRLAPYAAGCLAGFLPLAIWLAVEGLWPAFIRDVVAFNAGFPREPRIAVELVAGRPLVLAALGGAGLLLWHAWRAGHPDGWPLAAIGSATILASLAGLFTVQHALYNQQAAAIPGAIAFAAAGAAIAGPGGSRRSRARVAVLALFLFLSVRREAADLVQVPDRDDLIARPDVTLLAGLVRAVPGSSCVTFAPCHPVFCPDATDLSLMWDLFFLDHQDPYFHARHSRYWADAVDTIVRTRPRLVVERCGDLGLWEEAAAQGAIDSAALGRLRRTLRDHYGEYETSQMRIRIAR